MPVVTATEVTVYSNISASAATITASGLIPIVQSKINLITNNYFLSSEIYEQTAIVFNATARTLVGNASFETAGFASGDEIYVYNSYRNDGYKTTLTISAETITLATSESAISEKSGASILVSLVQWPLALKQIAAQMVAYEYDVRPNIQAGVKSESLGPASKSYTDTASGMPQDFVEALRPYTIVRLM